MAKYIIFVAAILSLVSLSLCVQWKDCGSKVGKPKSLNIKGCEGSGTCQLKRGSNVTFEVDFMANEQVTKATAVVHGIIEHIPIPFPLDHPDGCTESGLTCPLKSGGSFSYKSNIEVKSVYPKVRLVVKWELKDQSGNDIFCILLPAEIVDGDKPKKDNTLRFLHL